MSADCCAPNKSVKFVGRYFVMSSDRTPAMSAPSQAPYEKTPSSKPARSKRRKGEPQAEASIPLAEFGARRSKKARRPKIEINSELSPTLM